jgi:hypothetical protein
MVRSDGRRYSTLKLALEVMGVPKEFHGDIVKRWKSGPRTEGLDGGAK